MTEPNAEPVPGESLVGQSVPDEVIPHGKLPPLCYRDLPEPVSLRKMIGPSIILAGLALGSGEFVLWPYITYKSQFVFFWACLVGLATQYFINMEITRWTLATGESAITGFVRLGKYWAPIFLLLNILPWIIPAWATGAAELTSWLIWEPVLQLHGPSGTYEISGERYVSQLAIASLFGCGLILTAGPVIYETVEKIQMLLVGTIIVLILVLAAWMVQWHALAAQVTATLTLGYPDFIPRQSELDPALLLGALAFAGAGGTLNLGQSNYVKDKGYGMGRYIGRITSPITGQVESVVEIGYHFPDTQPNRVRWRAWWRAAGWEHFLSFFLTCLLCLMLLTLISYSIFYTPEGVLRQGADKYGAQMNFILGEAREVASTIDPAAKMVFLIMGVVILLTTEFGVLDAASRISTDLVKVTWLRENQFWSEQRLYYLFLWGTILAGSSVFLLKFFDVDVAAFELFKLTAAMNGAVMFLYCSTLLYLNFWKLPAPVRMSRPRAVAMVWAVLFFGFFAFWAVAAG